MVLQIIFPNEKTMKIEDLNVLKKDLLQITQKKNFSEKNDLDKLNKCLGKLQGYILVADRKKLSEYVNYFSKLQFLDIFNLFLDLYNEKIHFIILEMINFFTSNIQNKELLEYIYYTKYPVYIADIPGIKMNIIDKLISLNIRKSNEVISYEINFMKSLTLKIDINTLKYFYDSNINQFPILTNALSLYNHSDPLIKNVVKNIVLSLIKIEDKNLREFFSAFPINLYYSNIIFELKNTIIKFCSIDYSQNNIKNNYKMTLKYYDHIFDTILYLSDIFSLNIENINYILINILLNEIILPLINSIINYKDQEQITIYHSLYILCLILYSIKNEFIYNTISFFLFKEKISKVLYERISSSKFNQINDNILKHINSLIIKSQYADVNDPIWKDMSNMMKKTNGIDLSSGEIDFDNIYDFIKNLMNFNNENINNCIFENMKIFFTSDDDKIILILNLIITSCIKFYNSKKEDNSYNILNNPFFKIDLTGNNAENLFNCLFVYLNNSKNFRIATNEVILYNIQSFIKTYLGQNKNNEELKNNITKRLIKLIERQISKMENLFKEDENTIQYIFDSCFKAYQYYIKNINKKINELVTLSNILIPMIFLDKVPDVPMQLKQDKLNNDILKNIIHKIFYIYDIINELFDNKEDIIKNKKFPIEIETFNLTLGKEYNFNEIGEEYYHCNILQKDINVKSEAIFSVDALYFGEIMSKNFNDLSKIKIFKKIYLRYLEIQKGEDNCTLNIFDKTNPNTYKNVIKMNGLDANNTKTIYCYFLQKIFNCQLLEQNLFDSLIEKIKNKIEEIDID